MAPALPDDILHMICDSLVTDQAFGTLFSFCTVSKSAAVAAIKSLYKAQHVLSGQDDPSDEAIYEHELILQRWSILWRSIILSALGKTAFPYCAYIRMLDLRDFRNLIDEERFRGRIRGTFFSEDLKKFEIEMPVTRHRFAKLDVVAIVDAVGDLLTQNAPLVETLSGTIKEASLKRWIPRLPRLQSLDRLWDGEQLTADVAELLSIHCPNFNACSFFTGGPSQDNQLASFFSTLKEQSLESFETFSTNGFGAQCCMALARHSDTLTKLQLLMHPDVITRLDLLKPLTALQVLHLVDSRGSVDLEVEHKDVFSEVVEWLKSCKSLHSLKLYGLLSGAAIAARLLIQSNIRLCHLEVTGYKTQDQKQFHLAIAHQPDLESLVLDSDPVETRDDLDILVDALCELRKLRTLKLMNLSWYLNERHLQKLCVHLQMLEEFYTGGLNFTDNALDMVVTLPKLTEVTFAGITSITMEGLLEFCTELEKRNHHGVLLAIDNADPQVGLSEDEQQFMRAEFANRCGGKLEYTLYRDPNVSEFEGESSE